MKMDPFRRDAGFFKIRKTQSKFILDGLVFVMGCADLGVIYERENLRAQSLSVHKKMSTRNWHVGTCGGSLFIEI